MRESYLEQRGIAYRVNAFEEGRPTLLLLHGLSSSSSAWLPFETLLGQKYNLIIPDLRGHGMSRRYAHLDDYSMEKHAEDIDELLKRVRVERCIVVGYSVGALIALVFERLHKRSVEAVVFIAPLYKMHALWRVRLTALLVTAAASLARLLPAKQAGGRVDYSKLQHLGDEDPRRMWRDISTTGLRVYFYSLKQIYSFAGDAWWSKLSAPALILYGRHDTVLPEPFIIALARDIPHAILKEFPDGNHMLLYNNVEDVAAEIDNFVSKN